MSETHTILVVDDHPDNRELLMRRLEREGFRVVGAESGRQALDHVKGAPVSLILLDVMMPGMSGIEVLQAVRETHTASALPVIMVTAKAQSEDVVEALGNGANDYVTKPIDFPVALARIQAQLRIRRPPADDEVVDPRDLRPGLVIDGRYRLEARVGAGNFGTVYKARHLELDHTVAVKVLQSSAMTDPDAMTRFRREGITACRVRHPNAVGVLDFGITSRGVAYLVMELLAGYPLEDEIKGGRVLPLGRALRIVSAVGEALAVAHRAGIVHRDIKPGNVFLHQAGGQEVPKVLDFGIAKIAGAAALQQRVTLEGWIVGTPVYMAPERFGSEEITGEADVYSAGIMLYQMLTGRLPFDADSDPMSVAMKHKHDEPPRLRALRPDAPAAVEEAILSALRKHPSQRPTAAQFAALLQAALPPSPAPSPPR
ncbi:MAG TPA: response regulator [Vicinamibacteria bacterium]|nr:response regulator [Vicinamibacteria bacterium]